MNGESDIDEGVILELLTPFLPSGLVPAPIVVACNTYLSLLLKWSARTNLTAIRDARMIVSRHFGESLFAASHVGSYGTLLDFGSGAGLPGLPIQIARPEIRVTLAESQNKKVAFLQEVVRTLHLQSEIWPKRVEYLPISRKFDVVTMRAVDRMQDALKEASQRSISLLVVFSTIDRGADAPAGWKIRDVVSIPKSDKRVLLLMDPAE